MEHSKGRSSGRSQAQDWVCVMCNNLNYSFRKICNRCKENTRQNNLKYTQLHYIPLYDQSPYYDYHGHHKVPVNQFADMPGSPDFSNETNRQHKDDSQLFSWTQKHHKNSQVHHRWNPQEDGPFALVPYPWESLKQLDEPRRSASSESAGTQSEEEETQEEGLIIPHFDLTFL